jgi:hypothetical protein
VLQRTLVEAPGLEVNEIKVFEEHIPLNVYYMADAALEEVFNNALT